MKKYITFVAVSSLLFAVVVRVFWKKPILIRFQPVTSIRPKMTLQWLRMVRMQL